MKVKISQNGFLMIDRGTKGDPQWKTMTCPFTADSDGEPRAYCGDWCPHFGHVQFAGNSSEMMIQICHSKEIRFSPSNFIDERP